MVPTLCHDTAAVPPPAYQRALAKQPVALHLSAVVVVSSLHLLQLCGVAVRLAHRRCPPPLPKGPGGAPRVYREESLVLIALLRIPWRLSYQDMHDWLVAWPALATACGLPLGTDGWPRVPSPAQMCKRARAAGAPPCEMLFIVLVREALRRGVVRARDVIIDSAPILAWRRADPDATVGHALAQHPTRFLQGYRVHTLLCRGSGLPLLFLLSPAHQHDAPFARPLLTWAVRLYQLRPRIVRHGRGLLGSGPHPLDPHRPRRYSRCALEPQAHQEPLLPASHLDGGGPGQALGHRALLWPRLPLLPSATPAPDRLVISCLARRPDLRGHPRRRPARPPGGPA